MEIICRYPQFFAARLLKDSIVKSVKSGSGKGGTYFGATGCGKTYTMAFLARQLALRCPDVPEIGSPTIVMIVDREDLQKQSAKLFTRSQEFLNLGQVAVVKTVPSFGTNWASGRAADSTSAPFKNSATAKRIRLG